MESAMLHDRSHPMMEEKGVCRQSSGSLPFSTTAWLRRQTRSAASVLPAKCSASACPCQIWTYTSSQAHLRVCLEVAATKSLALAQHYDELVRKDWAEKSKRGKTLARLIAPTWQLVCE